jgi:hypothetical protein
MWRMKGKGVVNIPIILEGLATHQADFLKHTEDMIGDEVGDGRTAAGEVGMNTGPSLLM